MVGRDRQHDPVVTDVPQTEYDGELLPSPRFSTRRDSSRPTRGRLQAAFSDIWLQAPLMPWQRMVLDTGGELVQTDGLWVPRYPIVLTTLQRQGGKSFVTMAKTGERAMSVPNYRAWYTAQTGQDARDQFLKFDQETIGDRGPLRSIVTTLKGNGHEAMRWPNGSTLRPHPPTEKALHGKQSDGNDVDEAWAFAEDEGKALMQAIAPTQLTRPQAQTWIWSAGGTPESTWLAGLIARGRDGDPGICYHEWAIPDDLDLADLESIARYHPAFGHTVTLASIARLRANIPHDDEFARAAGNRWTDVIGGAIPTDVYLRARYADPIPDTAAVWLGAARSVDGVEVAVVAVALVGELMVAEVLDVMPAFACGEQVKFWSEATGTPVALDVTGPGKVLLDDLTTAGCPVTPLAAADASVSVDQTLGALGARRLMIRQHPAMASAVTVAGTRRVGDGGKAWAKVRAGSSIAPVEALSSAVWAVRRPAAEKMPAPTVHFSE